jgi:hypothetical protein
MRPRSGSGRGGTWRTAPSLPSSRPATELVAADVILVGIAHNSIPLSDETPCRSTFNEVTYTLDDWAKVTRDCADEAHTKDRPLYTKLYSTIAKWREGHPTLLLTINKYNDWNGWEQAHLTPDQVDKTVMMHDSWNAMMCAAATKADFTRADIYHAFNGADHHPRSGDLLGGDSTHPSQKGHRRNRACSLHRVSPRCIEVGRPSYSHWTATRAQRARRPPGSAACSRAGRRSEQACGWVLHTHTDVSENLNVIQTPC